MKLSEQIERMIRQHYPWLATDFNGATWESVRQQTERRIVALETHIQELERRYSELETRFNVHSQGTRHRAPKMTLPPPDQE